MWDWYMSYHIDEVFIIISVHWYHKQPTQIKSGITYMHFSPFLIEFHQSVYLRVRRSRDSFTFKMEIHIPVKTIFTLERGAGAQPSLTLCATVAVYECSFTCFFSNVCCCGKSRTNQSFKQILSKPQTGYVIYLNHFKTLLNDSVRAFPSSNMHDDVIKWKHFPRYWPFVRGIHRSPVNSPHKGQWHGALMFSLMCA